MPDKDALNASLIGKTYPRFTPPVTAERVSAYARAIGDESPVRHDAAAARALGYRDVVAPPTFGFTLALLAQQSDLALADIGVTVNETLHGEQEFVYGAAICAGDVLTGQQRVIELRKKKQDTLLFLTTAYEIDNQLGERVLTMTQTSIVPLRGNGA